MVRHNSVLTELSFIMQRALIVETKLKMYIDTVKVVKKTFCHVAVVTAPKQQIAQN